MTRTLIAGVDDTDRDADAVALATTLARATEASLVVASVCMYPALSSDEEALAAVVREDARRTAQAAAAYADLPDARAQAVAALSPSDGLCDLAEETGAKLIVVGSSRLGVVGRVISGSTPERLLQLAPCPIAVAPRGYATQSHEIAAIGVGFDGSAQSHAALELGAELARSTGAQLEAIGVLRLTVEPLVLSTGMAVRCAADLQALRAREERELSAAAKAVAGVATKVTVPVGSPSRVLADHGRNVDLLVVGSHAYGLLRRRLHGSVSTKLVRDAACPLIIVPPARSPGGPRARRAEATREAPSTLTPRDGVGAAGQLSAGSPTGARRARRARRR
jgi:nucleotide-binding universal stress UspA family protein